MSTINTQAGYKLAYFLDSGDEGQPPIVFVHGFPLDHRSWRNLLLTGRTEIRVDLPGFGSSGPPSGIGSMGVYACALIELLDQLGYEQAVFCAHSMGGYVCLETLAKYPKRVAGLALVGSQPLADSPGKALGRRETIDRLEKDGIEAVIGMADVLGSNNVGKEFFLELIRSQNPAAAIFAIQAMIARSDQSEVLLKTNIPRLVVHGAADGLVPFSAYPASLAAHGVTIELLAEIGHSPMIESPEVFSKALIKWLNATSKVSHSEYFG